MIRELLLCMLIIHWGSVTEQAKPQNAKESKGRVERHERRPDLAIKLDEVAQLKLASRKSMFHIGEMITLDIALLNTSSQPLFFRKLSQLDVTAVGPDGEKMMIQAYGVADRAVVAGSFARLLPGEIIVHSFQLLAGCDKRAFAQINSSEDDDRTVFTRGLFLNWGDACLANMQPETYSLSVEVRNSAVVLPPRSETAKTAVGRIKSNSFDITIRD